MNRGAERFRAFRFLWPDRSALFEICYIKRRRGAQVGLVVGRWSSVFSSQFSVFKTLTPVGWSIDDISMLTDTDYSPKKRARYSLSTVRFTRDAIPDKPKGRLVWGTRSCFYEQSRCPTNNPIALAASSRRLCES